MTNQCTLREQLQSLTHFILLCKKSVCKDEAETTPLILTTYYLRPAKIVTLKCLAFSWANGGSLFSTIKASVFHIFESVPHKEEKPHIPSKRREITFSARHVNED